MKIFIHLNLTPKICQLYLQNALLHESGRHPKFITQVIEKFINIVIQTHYVMDQSFYSVNVLNDGHRFDYLSIGLTAIHKAIVYYETDVPFLYSLVLADVEDDDSLSIYRISNNGDMKETLATVFRTIETFTNNNPRAIIGFQGNTETKNRLYRMAIAKDLDRFLAKFLIWGVRCDNGKRELFRPNQPYNFFFVTSKF